MPSFTHSLNIIGRCTQMQRGAVLKELGVCGGQVPYLLRLCRCPGLTQEELAKALYFNKSTVTRQIAALEEHLGVKLMVRSTRSLTLTSAGTAYLEKCRAILDLVDAAEAELMEERATPRGKLRVSKPPTTFSSSDKI